MNIYLTAPADYILPPNPVFRRARILYKVRAGKLYLAKGHARTTGGAAVVGVSELRAGTPVAELADEISAEVSARRFDGVVFDGGEGAPRTAAALADETAARIAPKPVFVAEPLGEYAPRAVVLVQSALSGGYLMNHIAAAVKKYGRERVAIELDRVIMDFTLPSFTGVGEEITRGEAERRRGESPVFFADSLCVNYFMYSDGNKHIVLYDDAESVNAKLALAAEFGIRDVFIYYPQVKDIFEGIRAR
ncbi:MAG: hypothetical protein LBS90_03220 [Oscillospiraceae bacterium]|jgi:hypothetical protein|nr:hypothetical protein [Oscillospiraceae bacterium]